jgi:GNAT superfamily N-acetyltransferase
MAGGQEAEQFPGRQERQGVVLRAGDGEVARVAEVIAASFQYLDSCRWLVPDPLQRRALFPPYLAMLTEHALRFGHVDYIRDEQGVAEHGRADSGGAVVAAAVWLDAPYPPVPGYRERLTRVCGPWTERFHLLDSATSAVQAPAERYAYLAYLGVHPTQQGGGVGGRLLTHALDEIDSDGRAVYLEASNARSAALYARHGFAFHAEPIQLPYDGEPIYPMWRPATRELG